MGAPPIQCYNCGGLGPKAFKCPSPLNYRKGGGAPEKKKGTQTPLSKTTNIGQDKPNQNTKTNQN